MTHLQQKHLSFPLIWGLMAVFVVSLGSTATIGDGTRSLYTGNAINESDGRGACVVDGQTYPSETAIPKDHPCHYCICYQAQVTCYWKACAAPPSGCQVMEFINACNPSLYVCDIPEETRNEPAFQWDQRPPRLRKKRIRRRRLHTRRVARETGSRTSLVPDRKPFDEGFPVPFEAAWEAFQSSGGTGFSRSKRAIDNHSSRSQYPDNDLLAKDTSCTILGVKYLLGEVIGLASDVCMECRCAAGVMFCSPKCCFLPSPFIPQPPPQEGHALFIRGDVVAGPRPRHPLHYVRNQYTEGQFLR